MRRPLKPPVYLFILMLLLACGEPDPFSPEPNETQVEPISGVTASVTSARLDGAITACAQAWTDETEADVIPQACTGLAKLVEEKRTELEAECRATDIMEEKVVLADELLFLERLIDEFALPLEPTGTAAICAGLLDPDVTFVDIDPSQVSLDVEEQEQLQAVVRCSNGTCDGDLDWGSLDPEVATVQETTTGEGPERAQVTGVSEGSTTVGAVFPPLRSVAGFSQVTVTGCNLSQISAAVELQGWPDGRQYRTDEFTSARTLEPGWTIGLEVSAEDLSVSPPQPPSPECLSDEWIWTTTDASVATVSDDGGVRAVSKGETYLEVEHADHPQIGALVFVRVVDTWLDPDGDLVPEPRYQAGGYSCWIGPNAPEGKVCENPAPDDPYLHYCSEPYVDPGSQFVCLLTINPYTDSREDCDPWAGSDRCIGTVVEVREIMTSTDADVSNYFSLPVTFSNETPMKEWWKAW